MKCVAIVLLSIAVLGFAEEQQPHYDPSFSDIIEKVQKQTTEIFTKVFIIPNQQAVDVNALKNQITTYVNNFENFIEGASAEVRRNNTELDKYWAEAKSKLNKLVEDINANVANVKESAEKLMKPLQEAVQTLMVKVSDNIAEASKASSGTIKENFASFIKKAVDTVVETLQNLNEQFKNAAKPAEKKN